MLLPDGLELGILLLASFESGQTLGLGALEKLDVLEVHLQGEEFVSRDGETRIHSRPLCDPRFSAVSGIRVFLCSESLFMDLCRGNSRQGSVWT